MKNNLTKVLAVLLTLCMLMGMMIVPTVAAEGDQTAGVITPDTSWYTPVDEGTTEDKNVYEISTAAQLLGFAKLANEGETFEGKTIKLTADIDLNPGWVGKTVTNEIKADAYYQYEEGTATIADAPANVWPEVTCFKGILDGQGYAISGIYAARTFKGDAYKAGFINEINGGTIKDLMIVNSVTTGTATSFSSSGQRFAGLVSNVKAATIQNVYIDMDVWWVYNDNDYKAQVAGLFGDISAKCEDEAIDDVVYAGKLGILDNMNGNTGDFNMVKEKEGATELWGILGKSNSSAVTTIGDIAFIGNIYKGAYRRYSAFAHSDYGKHVTAKATLASNDKDSYDGAATSEFLTTAPMNLKWNRVESEGTYGSRGWVACNIEGTLLPRSQVLGTYHYLPGAVAEMIQTSNFAYDTTSTNAAIEPDTSWFAEEEVEEEAPVFYIYDAADMYGLSVLANEGETFEGVVIKLMADIDLNPDWNYTSATSDDLALKSAFNKPDPANDWVPLEKFCGTFDGNGHTIKHMFSDVEVSSKFTDNRANGLDGGFIKELNGGAIKNFVITESTFVCTNTATYGSGNMYYGGLVGLASGSNPYIGNIYADFEAYFVTNYHFGFAGIVVYAENTTITVENIVFAGKLANISNSGVVGSTNTSVCYGPYGIIGHGGSDTATRILTNILSTPNLVPQSEEYNKGARPTNIYNATHVKNVTESNCYSAAVTTAVDGWTYVESKATYMPATVAAMLAANTQNLYLQKSVDGNAVRFIGVVNLTEAEMENFSSLGFNLSMTYNGKTYTKTYTTTTVYTSLIANGTTVDVSELGGTYFYAVEINGLDAAEGTVVFNVDGITVQAGETTTNVYGSVTVEYTK